MTRRKLIFQFDMSVSGELLRRSDQFDIRLNVDERRLKEIVKILDLLWNGGSVRYMHCTSVEVGDIPGRTSFGKDHVHIALIMHNYTTRASIIKKLVNKDYGWYVVPRDKTKSINGWINYHKKTRTKKDPGQPFLLQRGQLPRVRESRSLDEGTMSAKQVERYKQWNRRKALMQNQMWEQLDQEFPGFI